jgi:NADH dehydrogenase FAD-containing subunit
VLRGLARQAASDWSVSLVAPHPYYIEAGMLPGYVAGHYALDDIRVPLDALVQASGAQFVPAHVLALDPAARRVQLSTGDALPYDVLSIDVEPAPEREAVEAAMPGARGNAMFLRPMQAFVQLWPQLQQLAQQRPLQVAVIAERLPGIELAMAAAHALAAPHGSRVTLVAGDAPLLAGLPAGLQRRVLARLKALDITVLQDRCIGIEPGHIALAGGATLQCDAPLLAHGLGTPGWLAASGLQTAEDGSLQLNERLQSDSHRQVFVVPPARRSRSAPRWRPTCAPRCRAAPSAKRRWARHGCTWWAAATTTPSRCGARWPWKGARSGTGRTGATAGSWPRCSRCRSASAQPQPVINTSARAARAGWPRPRARRGRQSP